MKRLYFLSCGALIIALCSCSNFKKKFSYVPESKIKNIEIEQKNQWWRAFKDPVINKMVDDLLEQNLDIKIAQLRIDEARGMAKAANANFFPDISASVNGSRGNKQIFVNKPFSIAQGGFDAKWEIDVFGQTRALVDSTQRRVESRTANAEDVTNSVIAELIKNIVEWRQAQQNLREIQALLFVQDEKVSLISSQSKSGLIQANFLKSAEAERAQTSTDLHLAKASLAASEFRIERLLGKKSGSLQDYLENITDELFVPQASNILDISIEVIKQRPDIRASRAELLAAKADLAKAEADLWPKITIGAFFGAQDVSVNVPLANNPIWSISSGITAPIFNFGKLRAVVDSSNAKAEAAALSYENAILIALQETKTALSDYLNGINAVNEQLRAVNYQKDNVAFAKDRFDKGLTDMTDLSNAEIQLNQVKMLLIARKSEAAIAYVRLQKALGTSFAINANSG